jgi:hypothetical protein
MAAERDSALSLPWVLFIVFLVLKLCNVIDWSWWWVFAPLWIPLVVSAVLAGAYFGTIGLVAVFRVLKDRRDCV